MYIKDPLQVKYYETKLKRKLTESERIGETPVYMNGQKVYLEIRDVHFPYDFMDRTTLIAVLKRYNK